MVQFMRNLIGHIAFPLNDVIDMQLVSINSLLMGFLKLALFTHLLLHLAGLNVLR